MKERENIKSYELTVNLLNLPFKKANENKELFEINKDYKIILEIEKSTEGRYTLCFKVIIVDGWKILYDRSVSQYNLELLERMNGVFEISEKPEEEDKFYDAPENSTGKFTKYVISVKIENLLIRDSYTFENCFSKDLFDFREIDSEAEILQDDSNKKFITEMCSDLFNKVDFGNENSKKEYLAKYFSSEFSYIKKVEDANTFDIIVGSKNKDFSLIFSGHKNTINNSDYSLSYTDSISVTIKFNKCSIIKSKISIDNVNKLDDLRVLKLERKQNKRPF